MYLYALIPDLRIRDLRRFVVSHKTLDDICRVAELSGMTCIETPTHVMLPLPDGFVLVYHLQHHQVLYTSVWDVIPSTLQLSLCSDLHERQSRPYISPFATPVVSSHEPKQATTS